MVSYLGTYYTTRLLFSYPTDRRKTESPTRSDPQADSGAHFYYFHLFVKMSKEVGPPVVSPLRSELRKLFYFNKLYHFCLTLLVTNQNHVELY